jgi:hypothetical protein
MASGLIRVSMKFVIVGTGISGGTDAVIPKKRRKNAAASERRDPRPPHGPGPIKFPARLRVTFH